MSDAVAGSTLFEEGDPADGVSAILEGRVEVVRQGRVLATLGPGSVLGELSVFVPSATRTATARASSPVRMITWRADDVPGRLARHERLATAIVADMASCSPNGSTGARRMSSRCSTSPAHACPSRSWSVSAAAPWSSPAMRQPFRSRQGGVCWVGARVDVAPPGQKEHAMTETLERPAAGASSAPDRADAWLSAFEEALTARDVDRAAAMFAGAELVARPGVVLVEHHHGRAPRGRA